MLECARNRNMPTPPADDDRELAFVVESLRDGGVGTPQRLAMSDDGDRHALKDLRMIRRGGEAGLVDMHLEIERQRPGRLRIGDDRIELHLIEAQIALIA